MKSLPVKVDGHVNDLTMRRSPRRPLILKRRKLPFHQNEPAPADTPVRFRPSDLSEPSKPATSQCFPDGIRVLDHPSMSDTQVVVIPKEADLQSVIGALTAKGKEYGVQGPNKFILLSEGGRNESFCQISMKEESASATEQLVNTESVFSFPDAKPLVEIKSINKDVSCGPLNDSLTNIQWLGKMSTCALESDPLKQMTDKENQIVSSEKVQEKSPYTCEKGVQQPVAERPPYSYMTMIQFAINSRNDRRMTLKEIYTWIEDNFPYYREVAKPGWKNSIRHNLSLHDMFVRESSPDGKISFWTIRPEVNRRLTLDQVYKPCCDPVTAVVPVSMLSCPHQKMNSVTRKTPASSERKIKPLLPRTESFLVPIQLPVASSLYLPSSSASFGSSFHKHKQTSSRGAKRVRIAPKVMLSSTPVVAESPLKSNNLKVEVKEEPLAVPIRCETPKAPSKKQASSSRRKQRLVNSLHEEPVLLCLGNTFVDSGVASDASAFQDIQEVWTNEHQHGQDSPDREFSFKTPIKSSSHLTSSTPSKPPSTAGLEQWKVTPVGKGSQNVLDFSPIRTPGGPPVTPRQEYNTFSMSSTPFKELPLFGSPSELLTLAASRVSGPAESPIEQPRSSCSRELLQGAAGTPSNQSLTEGLILDVMNESLSKILVDFSFTGLENEDLSTANISLSEFIGQF